MGFIVVRFFDSFIFKTVGFSSFRSIIILSIFSNFLLLTIPIYTLQVYDRVLNTRSEDTLFFLTFGVIIALLIVSISDTIKSYLLVRFANKLEVKLNTLLINSIVSESAKNIKQGIGSLRDQEKIKNFLAGQHGLITFFDAPWVPIFVIIVYLIHPILSMVLAFFMISLFILTILTEKTSESHLEKANKLSTQTLSNADEISRNAQIIEAMGMRKSMINYWSKIAHEKSYYQSTASDRAAFFINLAKLLRYAQTVVLTAVGAYLAINNEMTIGGMIAANILASKAAAPMEGIITSWKNFHGTKESFQRLNKSLENEAQNTVKTILPDIKGSVEVQNLIFKPSEEQDPIIKNISFKINAGEFLGIVGPSGSGKSTMVKLLVGIHLTSSGKINIDDADINIWDSHQLGNSIGYLSQDVSLLNGTIKENIARFSDASDEEIIEAAQKANAHQLILNLPNGYDTVLNNNAQILSGGQKQRIALARAFFRNPQIIILDEPNSSLDNEGDIALIKALQVMKAQGATIIVIAHRPSILQNADKLAVFSEGKLQLFGPYKEVASKLMPQNN